MRYNYRGIGSEIGILILFTIIAMIATPILELIKVSFPQRLFLILAIVYLPFIAIEWFRIKDITYTIVLSLLAIIGMPAMYHFVWSISSGINFTILVFTFLFLLINIIVVVIFIKKHNRSLNNTLINNIETADSSKIDDFFHFAKTVNASSSSIFKIRNIEDLESKIVANRDATYDVNSVKEVSSDLVLISLKSGLRHALVLTKKASEQIQILVFPNVKSTQHQTEVSRIIRELKTKT